MSNVEQLESQVKRLIAEELEAFRDWFAKFDADAWDQQIKADSKRGALDSLASRALADYQAGRSTTSDPKHPSIHFKKIDLYWSARIGLHYRALALEVPDGVLWFWIGTLAEYDAKVRSQ